MASEIATIQSLKAVDAWIDVINANINGGVRTGFKSSRLKFSGSNVDIQRSGTGTSLPLQFPEAGLTTANTVIDFTQGAITASTENTHLAIQGEGYFLLMHPSMILATGGTTFGVLQNNQNGLLLTRDGEFRTNQQGFLVHSCGWYLVTASVNDTTGVWTALTAMRAVYNNLDNPANATGITQAVRLSDYLANTLTTTTLAADGTTALGAASTSLVRTTLGQQSLQYSQFGSTIFDAGHRHNVQAHFTGIFLNSGRSDTATILSKSLEASNASMTQSVPELSLAQKLFSALTKVLQTKQTNVDGVLNLVR